VIPWSSQVSRVVHWHLFALQQISQNIYVLHGHIFLYTQPFFEESFFEEAMVLPYKYQLLFKCTLTTCWLYQTLQRYELHCTVVPVGYKATVEHCVRNVIKTFRSALDFLLVESSNSLVHAETSREEWALMLFPDLILYILGDAVPWCVSQACMQASGWQTLMWDSIRHHNVIV
jgi:hypothetical protein